MNVLKPDKQTSVVTLLKSGVSQHEIQRKLRIDRKTVRRYGRLSGLLGAGEEAKSPRATGGGPENPPPRPPGQAGDCADELENPPWPPRPEARSECAPYQEWIAEQVERGRNAMAIYQDLVDLHGFRYRYNSVKRYVGKLRKKEPEQYDRLEYPPGEEAQVDYGLGAKARRADGKVRRPRLFIMTLKYSRRSFRKVVWESGQKVWAQLHEEAFTYFGGCPQYVVLDNLKEGVITPDIYEPGLNAVYQAMLHHYGVVADPARPGDCNRKGTVESAVQHTQETALKGREFESLEAQNAFLRHWEETWASRRIHGRMKRQVEEMFQQEKPHLRSLPLEGFRYFEQVTRTIADDGLIQVDKRFYAALPLPIGSRAVVRIYENAIEILHPLRMEVVRRHQKGLRPGDFKMEPGDRVFNPSEQTQYLLKQAGRIGPRTTELCQRWFQQEGRPGHRKLYGVINLARKHPAVAIEQAAVQALAADLHSYPAFCRLVERKRDSSSSAAPGAVAQQHQLIRPSADYGTFWNQYASHAEPALPPPLVCPEQAAAIVVAEPFLDRTQLAEIWQRASWRRVIAVLGLEVDVHRHSRAGEIWLKSPFTAETQASLHVDEGRHLFKDFSSGVGGGILQFCQRWFQQQGQPRTIYEVARWMLQEGICPPPGSAPPPLASRPAPAGCVETERLNPVIPVDLRRYLRPDHPHVYERGLSPATCRYLGCGFLPERTGGGGSPLNGRFVFQVRSLRPQGEGLVSVVVGHTGRALTEHQQVLHGKYWAYPFHKGWELYNQDHLLLDPEARRQTAAQGLLLVEGFFDVAALVEAGCRNVVALMGTALTPTQVERIAWLQQKISFTKIQLFLDRDPTGRQGAASACDKLSTSRLTVSVFDWDQLRAGPTGELQPIASAIQDPAEMPMAQLQWLRQQHFI